jgi:2,4-dienoyl-CoA reductase-like NADH-dependent reductase (Old Yellow Enzyme family)
MPMLFETTTIKSLSLTNRFVRSVTWEGMAKDDGSCSPMLTDLMVRLAKGRVGLVITSHAYLNMEDKAASSRRLERNSNPPQTPQHEMYLNPVNCGFARVSVQNASTECAKCTNIFLL